MSAARLGIYVDDEDEVYAEYLSVKGELEFERLPIQEVARLARSIIERRPDAVALDYRLDEEPGDLGPDRAFKGSALAQHLRDEATTRPDCDFPIVLVSAEEKIKRSFGPDRTAHDLFDQVMEKGWISERRGQAQAEIVGLADGYRVLNAVPDSNFQPQSVLGLDDDEAEDILRQEHTTAFKTARVPHVVAAFVLRNLVRRPGLLLDDANAAARLGIVPADLPKVAPFLRDAGVAYAGVFSTPLRRWWAHRLEAWASSTFGGRLGNMTASARASLLNERLSVEVSPAHSPWTRGVDELVVLACASCERPVELRHTVGVFEPSMPRHATQRRICWDCLQTDAYEHGNHPLTVVDSDLALVAEVQAIKRPE